MDRALLGSHLRRPRVLGTDEGGPGTPDGRLELGAADEEHIVAVLFQVRRVWEELDRVAAQRWGGEDEERLEWLDVASRKDGDSGIVAGHFRAERGCDADGERSRDVLCRDIPCQDLRKEARGRNPILN